MACGIARNFTGASSSSYERKIKASLKFLKELLYNFTLREYNYNETKRI
jgi:hypothetical protein